MAKGRQTTNARRTTQRERRDSKARGHKTLTRKTGRNEETLADRQRRAERIIAGLKELYPEATCALRHDSALQLLISTILSAQSTDETVNKVTPVLFGRFPTAEALAGADPAEVEEIIHATGFFRQKTRSVIGACRKIVESFGGRVPDTMEELVTLPGVARKTANVVLGTWFGKNVGVVVDTHVGRLSHRLGLTWTSKDEKDAVRIEQDLMQVLPRNEWTYTGHALIWHGRRVCTARKPRCAECRLSTSCPSAFAVEQGREHGGARIAGS
ncbi:MAG: endonuclease III [Phycisphaerae bacterium]|jgi:endonuclease-3